MAAQVIKSGFLALLEQVAKERNIEVDDVVTSIEAAIEAALRKDRPELFAEEILNEDGDLVEPEDSGITFKVELDRTEGTARIFRMEDDKREDVTPAGFGRIAAQTAKNVIFQKVREAERGAMLANYRDRIGSLVQGVILRYDGRNAVVDLGRGQGIMPPEEQMRGEFYRPNLRLVMLIKEIKETPRGEQVMLSRADENLVIKLFEREVPEMASGAVEVKSIAREAGVRTKMAVFSDQSGVDPVGACVGQRGVRVQEVIRDVNNEKIDIIQYSENEEDYLKAALSPAESLVIKVNKKQKTAVVTAPDDQIALVVGRGGQNVRLAAKLTGYQITVESAAGEAQASVTGDEEYEIDQLLEISEDTRKLLIDERATTLEDLARKWDNLQEKGEISASELKTISSALEKYQAEMAELPERHPRLS
jgi:N utilization substance protein A